MSKRKAELYTAFPEVTSRTTTHPRVQFDAIAASSPRQMAAYSLYVKVKTTISLLIFDCFSSAFVDMVVSVCENPSFQGGDEHLPAIARVQ